MAVAGRADSESNDSCLLQSTVPELKKVGKPKVQMPFLCGRLLKQRRGVLETRAKRAQNVLAHFITARADGWPDCRPYIPGVCAEFLRHSLHCFECDFTNRTPPAGVDNAYRGLRGIVKKDGDTICSKDAQGNVRDIRDESVSCRYGVVITKRSHPTLAGSYACDVLAMHLLCRCQGVRVKSQFSKDDSSILKDADRVIAGVQTGIRASERRPGIVRAARREGCDNPVKGRFFRKCASNETCTTCRQFFR